MKAFEVSILFFTILTKKLFRILRDLFATIALSKCEFVKEPLKGVGEETESINQLGGCYINVN
ncbi:hypothetical protein CN354_17735 [Bacillus cereus]|nr:hypothetical protein CN354_17735 [Bacillus cereus]